MKDWILHVTCQTDELDDVVARYGESPRSWRLTHVVSPDFREGVKEWHLFLERTV